MPQRPLHRDHVAAGRNESARVEVPQAVQREFFRSAFPS